MEQVIETIKRIEKSRTALRQAIADNERATSPRLKDLSLVPKIYKLFEEIKGADITTNNRKEFIFVIIYLYCPNKFFGGKMPQGLRRVIAKTVGVTCGSVISATCTELLILYTTYEDFRQGVDELLDDAITLVSYKNITKEQ